MDWTDLSPYEQDMRHKIVSLEHDRAAELARPFYLLRPRLYADGNMWCALYGDDLQIGVAGFGETPAAAARSFDDAWENAQPGKQVARLSL